MERQEYVLKPFRDNADYINSRVKSGIEGRKGSLKIAVTDSDGKLIKGAHISYNQTAHDFNCGANLFMLDEFETPEKNAVFREVFKEYFNFATLPFYWETLEPEEGMTRYTKNSPRIYRRPAPDLCLEYCEQSGITPKAHCLNYDACTPEWVNKYDKATQWKLLEKRFSECAERYANRIHGWEVTNELFWDRAFSKMYFDPDYMEHSFELARRYFPNNELICNEGGEPFREFFAYNRNPYFMQVERAKKNGAPIDTVGFQYHIWSIPQNYIRPTPENEAKIISKQCNPMNMYRVFDTFSSAFNCPMQITEITLPCFEYSKEAEDIQAELLKNLYTIWFSIPNIEAVIYWNLVDGYTASAEPGDFTAGQNVLYGGLMNFDMTPKPALKMIKHLFTKEWHTKSDTVTDESGVATISGFFGTYDADITVNGKTVRRNIHLKKGENGTLTLVL